MALSLLSAGVGAYGDDTEVFYSVNVSKPNLLFVLDVSGSMSGTLDGSGVITSTSQYIQHSSADSTQLFSNGSTNLTDSAIELNSAKLARFRFKDLGILQRTNIESAYIQFQAGVQANNGQANSEAKFKIYTEASDNAQLTTNGINANNSAGIKANFSSPVYVSKACK